MDSLICGPSRSKRPVFLFEGHENLTSDAIPTGQLGLAGPSEPLDSAHWPVRGDLAHIRLAGRVFVPHYAVPMPRKIAAGGAALVRATQEGADVLDQLPGGTLFNVLDLAGQWAWGQVGDDGLVGYVPIAALAAE